MKYYSKIIFNSLIALNILAIIITIVVAYFVFIFSAMGGSFVADYDEVITKLFVSTIGIILFLLFSIVFLFIQQYKNRRFGYLMLVLVPIDIFIIYKIFSPILPVLIFSDFSLENILWILSGIIILLVALIPFYVLGRLIKEDFFKKNKN